MGEKSIEEIRKEKKRLLFLIPFHSYRYTYESLFLTDFSLKTWKTVATAFPRPPVNGRPRLYSEFPGAWFERVVGVVLSDVVCKYAFFGV